MPNCPAKHQGSKRRWNVAKANISPAPIAWSACHSLSHDSSSEMRRIVSHQHGGRKPWKKQQLQKTKIGNIWQHHGKSNQISNSNVSWQSLQCARCGTLRFSRSVGSTWSRKSCRMLRDQSEDTMTSLLRVLQSYVSHVSTINSRLKLKTPTITNECPRRIGAQDTFVQTANDAKFNLRVTTCEGHPYDGMAILSLSSQHANCQIVKPYKLIDTAS